MTSNSNRRIFCTRLVRKKDKVESEAADINPQIHPSVGYELENARKSSRKSRSWKQYSTLHLTVRHRDVTRRLNKQALISGRFKSGFQFARNIIARELFALSKSRSLHVNRYILSTRCLHNPDLGDSPKIVTIFGVRD